MKYAIVIEKADSNYSAYVPDLPGCVATGATTEEAEKEIREAGVDPDVQIEVTRPVYVNPVRKESCDVWVQMSYENASDIVNTKLKILDSKPPGMYDDEALEVLLSYVSYGHHSPLNSRIFVRHKKGGSREQIFTYFKGCKDWAVSREKPNKSLNTDAGDAGSG